MGLLYGVHVGSFILAAGVASVWGRQRGNYLYTETDPLWGTGRVYEEVKYRTIGFPAEIRYAFRGKYAGIGLTAFGNYNAKSSFIGGGLSAYLGRLK